MTDNPQPVLKFENPPIVEKLMGIQFAPLEKWSIPHFGLFWEEIRDSFPKFSIQPPLVSEAFTPKTPEEAVRCWFFHESQTKIIQVQRDRFLYNWQKPTGFEQYPHYASIRPEFEKSLLGFYKFLDKNQIDQPSINQCEITYVDHLERGREWQQLSDLPNVINGWSGMSGRLLTPNPDFLTIQIAYPLPDIDGNLLITFQPAFRHEDQTEVFQIRVTVTGVPASRDVDDVMLWFDSGRDFAVQGFVDLTTEKMHDLWGKRG